MRKASQLEQMYRALGDVNRLRILQMLVKGEMNAGELLQAIDIAQSTLSHHMKSLVDADLVRARRHGKWTYYSLNHQILEEMSGFLRALGGEGGKELAVASDRTPSTKKTVRRSAPVTADKPAGTRKPVTADKPAGTKKPAKPDNPSGNLKPAAERRKEPRQIKEPEESNELAELLVEDIADPVIKREKRDEVPAMSAGKEKEEKEKAAKEKAAKEKSDKEKTAKEKSGKQKSDKDKAEKGKKDKTGKGKTDKGGKEKSEKEKSGKEKSEKEKADKEKSDKKGKEKAGKKQKKK